MDDVVSEAGQLIGQLNDPQYAQLAPQISTRLQAIQLSSDGWHVAHYLLRPSEDFTFQFYGALTYQIKLNRDGRVLSTEDAGIILEQLISALIGCVGTKTPRFVFDKICSALSTYFIRSPAGWPLAIVQIASSLEARTYIPSSALKSGTYSSGAGFFNFDSDAQAALLRFSRLLVEDLTGLEGSSVKHHELEESLKSNSGVIFRLIDEAIGPGGGYNCMNQADAFELCRAWLTYAQPQWTRDPDVFDQTTYIMATLADYTAAAGNLTMAHLSSDMQTTVANNAAEALINVMEQSGKLQFRLEGKFEETLAHIITSGERYWPSHQSVLKYVLVWGRHEISGSDFSDKLGLNSFVNNLIGRSNWTEDGCETLQLAVEYWSEYASQADLLGIPTQPQIHQALIEAVHACLPIVDLPPERMLEEIEDDVFEDWQRLRSDVLDFVQLSSSMIEDHLYTFLNLSTIQAVQLSNWRRVESLLSIWTYLVDDAPESYNNLVRERLGSELLANIFVGIADPTVRRAQRALLVFIDAYVGGVGAINARKILMYLLRLLQQGTPPSSKIADQAARTIVSLCSTYRRDFAQHLTALWDELWNALAMQQINAFQKDKINVAIASLIQAIPDEAAKIAPLSAVIVKLRSDLEYSEQLRVSGQYELADTIAVDSLQRLAAIGKGLRPMETESVDLESKDVHETPNDGQYWISGPGQIVQEHILSCLRSIDSLRHNGDAWDAVSDILREGLASEKPGPFTLPINATVAFLEAMDLQTPRIEALLMTACAFASAHSRSQSERLLNEVSTVYRAVGRIIVQLADPTNDPQIAQLCIEFLDRLTHRYADVLLGLSPPELLAVFGFVFSCINGTAPMPKRAAATFLTGLLEIAGPKGNVTDPEARLLVQRAVHDLSPHLAMCLMSQIGGNAQRSELDSIAKVLRAFITTQPAAKRFLEAALKDPAFPSTSISESDKGKFLQKVVMLRGARQTNNVVKEFWAACKGTVSSF